MNSAKSPSINVKVNGTATVSPRGVTVRELLLQLDIEPTRDGIAVAVNREIVPRSRWGAHALEHSDEVEIVQAAQGG